MSAWPDIIVPIHDAFEALERCVHSLVRTVPAGVRMVLIDDASADARVQELFGQLARDATRQWLLLTNPDNQGFVHTANRGLLLSDRDVVLLNSDTRTTRGWLEGLRRCAQSDRRIGTATPFSNNAEICSLPAFCRANPVPDDPEAVAAALRDSGPPVYPEIPTAVGFCMYISRAALDAVGVFDAETFSPGYGEENDLCMRARAAGFRHVLCDDVYVVHEGGASFAPRGRRAGGEAMEKLLARHPSYEHLVRDFIAADPLKQVRQRVLDRVRAAGATHAPLL